ncbi:MAG: hypothetical protein SLAVMIC_00081 [uncultured marine phage]|uniref:Uncharacterized protein n=1 Tax=uncultured marine phage TaxID=707152 RepID=A0A8D9CEK3_9VIRU|nr:MAG: hypothetical protein SLAVMIC_00081 [uncultured marine phage]
MENTSHLNKLNSSWIFSGLPKGKYLLVLDIRVAHFVGNGTDRVIDLMLQDGTIHKNVRVRTLGKMIGICRVVGNGCKIEKGMVLKYEKLQHNNISFLNSVLPGQKHYEKEIHIFLSSIKRIDRTVQEKLIPKY